jgi:hypothetical protein
MTEDSDDTNLFARPVVPFAISIPVELWERVGRYMEGKPFKSFDEAITFLLEHHPALEDDRCSE